MGQDYSSKLIAAGFPVSMVKAVAQRGMLKPVAFDHICDFESFRVIVFPYRKINQFLENCMLQVALEVFSKKRKPIYLTQPESFVESGKVYIVPYASSEWSGFITKVVLHCAQIVIMASVIDFEDLVISKSFVKFVQINQE